MKGFIRPLAAGSCFSAVLFALAGCYQYRNAVDPCWPERYATMSRQSVRDITNAQADKGHVLDQTVWGWHFETDPKTGGPTDRLNSAGIEHLRYLGRRQPMPDTQIYLQSAAEEGNPDQRRALNEKRAKAIQNFLAASSLAKHSYQIAVHELAAPGINATPIVGSKDGSIKGAVPALENNFKGVLPIVNTGTSSSGGSSGGSSGQ